MPYFWSFILILASLAANPLEAQPLESKVDAVTVYPEGAEVTRVLRVSLAAGANEILLEDLPPDFDHSSLQARLATRAARVRSVRSDVLQRGDAHDAEVRRLEEQTEETREKIATSDDVIEAAERQLALLDALAQDFALSERGNLTEGQADLSTWKQALDVIGESSIDAKQRIRGAQRRRRENERILSALERELASKRRRVQSTRILVEVESESQQDTELYLSYFQWGAAWSANYSAFLDSDTSTLRLEFDASVRQFTNEPWNQVQLTLSTATPTRGMQAPRQDSQFLDLIDAHTEWAYLVEGEASPFARGAQSAEVFEEMVLAAPELSPSQASRFAVSYRVPRPVDLSNAEDLSQSVPIATYNWDVSLVSRTNPRQDPHAFLAARTRYREEAPLIGGSLRVFVDGIYSGSTSIGQLLPGSDAEFPLGLDRNIEVLALNQGGGKGRQGVLSARNTLLTDFLFEIRNQHAKQVEVEVMDYYPVSRDEQIEVSIPPTSTQPTERDIKDRPGVLVWRKELDAGEHWRIRHQYEISYPKDTSVLESPESHDSHD